MRLGLRTAGNELPPTASLCHWFGFPSGPSGPVPPLGGLEVLNCYNLGKSRLFSRSRVLHRVLHGATTSVDSGFFEHDRIETPVNPRLFESGRVTAAVPAVPSYG